MQTGRIVVSPGHASAAREIFRSMNLPFRERYWLLWSTFVVNATEGDLEEALRRIQQADTEQWRDNIW